MIATLCLMPRQDLVLRITVLVMVLYGATGWQAKVILAIFGGTILIHPDFIYRRGLWLVMLASVAYSNVLSWYSIDNHKYLMMYWLLACSLAIGSSDVEGVLRTNARLLVGLCFLFATAWKLLGGQYLDGSFLHGTMLMDGRLRTFAAFASGLSENQIYINRSLASLLRGVDADGATVVAVTSDRLHVVALVMSYWTILVEGTVAVLFLITAWTPRGGWRSGLLAARDLSLVVFVCTTYFLLPVVPFAMMLCVLGLAQVERDRYRTLLVYMTALLVTQLSMIPWTRYASELAGL